MIAFLEKIMADLFGQRQELPIPVRAEDSDDKSDIFARRTSGGHH
ncbi:hypothetical protein [Sulfitobacter mediterraneus]|nr:hypothetical protein [Sulfitobacter mediterraneus]